MKKLPLILLVTRKLRASIKLKHAEYPCIKITVLGVQENQIGILKR